MGQIVGLLGEIRAELPVHVGVQKTWIGAGGGGIEFKGVGNLVVGESWRKIFEWRGVVIIVVEYELRIRCCKSCA